MRKPLHPWAVMALAVVLPGVGHVASRQPVRGLIFLFFMILLGAFTATTAAPGVSAVGKYAGGLFVWAMSILDAYRIGRIRYEVWRHQA
ncbi:MAG: membrane protein [Rhodobacter sp. CACIA14H1]|nr:MAG: membrane protein [Rhodobacter sp. CACIA14H1]